MTRESEIAEKAVACPEPPAAAVAAAVMAEGGSIADASIAAAFAQCVANPLGTGIGGMAQALVATPDSGEPVSINATVEVGSVELPDEIRHSFRGRSERAGRYLVEGDLNQFGYTSIMTPGFVRGMEAVSRELGSSLGWEQLVAPAARLAAEGIEVYPYLHHYYTKEGPPRPGYPGIREKLANSPSVRARYLPNGEIPQIGDVIAQPEYGQTLERIARNGPDEFYSGSVARTAAADLQANGALTTAEDLERYTVRVEKPISLGFHNIVVHSAPPPSQGLILLMMLGLVEPLLSRDTAWNAPDYLEIMASAMCAAFEECLPYLGDPAFVETPSSWLLSAQHLSAVRGRVNRSPRVLPVPDGTTHLSAADATGTFVSLTHTLGSILGAGAMTPGLGFLYNNFLGQLNVLRGYHDSVVPGKRIGGGCPSILVKDGTPFMAIGSSGGPRLFSAVFQTIVNSIIFGMSLAEAVSAPRIHCEQAGRLYMEPSFPSDTIERMRKRGYDVLVSDYMGCNQAVAQAGNGVEIGNDPRGGAGVAAL